VVIAVDAPGACASDVLAGVPLALRAVLALQKEKLARVWVVAAEGERVAVEAMLNDPRVRVPVTCVAAPPGAHPLGALAGVLDGDALVLRHEVVCDPTILRALRDDALGDALAVAAVHDEERLGPMVVSPAALGALGAAKTDDALWAALGEAGSVRALDVRAAWSARVTDAAGRRRAFHELFEACRKPVDGIVSRHLNRHVSLFVSRRIVGLPFTPNHVSAVTFLFGLAGALSCARGGYWAFLVGTVLFQLNSILDGVDGELARVRYQQSKLGEWVDTIGDDSSNVLFYAGLAVGVSRMPDVAWLAWMGYLAALFGVLTAAMYYTELVRLGSGDFYALGWSAPPPGFVGGVVTFFRYITKKDFFILLFVAMALAGVLPWALPIMLGGTTLTVCAGVVRTIKWMRAARGARARGESPAS